MVRYEIGGRGRSASSRTRAATESDNNLLHSEVARFDFTPLEEKAADLRRVLLEKGWTALH